MCLKMAEGLYDDSLLKTIKMMAEGKLCWKKDVGVGK